MTRIALFSASAQNPAYCLPAAWSARLWRDAGWKPFVLVMGGFENGSEWDDTPQGRYVRSLIPNDCWARVGGGKDPWMPIPDLSHNPGFHAATVCRRIVAASNLFDPETVILLADSDMLPLDVSGFGQWDVKDQFHVFGADYFGKNENGWTRYPSCYQVARNGVWSEILGERVSWDNVEAATYNHIVDGAEFCRRVNGEYAPGKPRVDCEPLWQWKLDPWGAANPGRLVLHPRFPRERRLVLGSTRMDPDDASRVYVEADPIDCHVRDRWRDDGNWRMLMGNMPKVRPETREWLDFTRDKYLSL